MQRFFNFFICIIVFSYLIVFPPLPHIFVTHDETNQAKCNKSSNEQLGKSNDMKQIDQLCAANWTDLTICNKLSNNTNHVSCNQSTTNEKSSKLLMYSSLFFFVWRSAKISAKDETV